MDEFLWAIEIVTAVGLVDDDAVVGAAIVAVVGVEAKVGDADLAKKILPNRRGRARSPSLRVGGQKNRSVWI